ncbi:hypothetical protein [Spirosoma endbachense]|uniref:Uncharacterized protein n=1 Tax=Spirosoma endbachense TaxID=2666025 RepID=A0A6P1W2Z6_9BACT|nr:hypothetical protein [Spirosoma endbachense]QHV99264.1 hypothetical protein GJR95_31500 [Spirosoma endbachense]
MQSRQLSALPLILGAFFDPILMPTTLADLDREKDFLELEQLVGQLAGPHCLGIEFLDDNRKHGCRALEFRVTVSVYNGRIEFSEDGKHPDTSTIRETVWVPVRDTDTIQNIAERVTKEVQGIDCNIHA